MKILGLVFLAVGLASLILLSVFSVRASYQYDNQIGSYWSLSQKASTLQGRAQYFNEYVSAIESANLSGNDAIFLKTPDNSYEQNLAALKTAQQRFQDVQSIDPTSFQYSQTMQQIEGAGAQSLDVFRDLWYLKYYPLLWSWIWTTELITAVLLIFAGYMVLISSYLIKRTQGKSQS